MHKLSYETIKFQHTAARRRLVFSALIKFAVVIRFNTQPPEGGWLGIRLPLISLVYTFQHTAARRRLVHIFIILRDITGFNTQPPEGGWVPYLSLGIVLTSFQHTAARRRLAQAGITDNSLWMFQHTAARRRLERPNHAQGRYSQVSTHSRPKAAGSEKCRHFLSFHSFNTQPPEGGWASSTAIASATACFNTQPPEGGWRTFGVGRYSRSLVSTHSRPKAAG